MSASRRASIAVLALMIVAAFAVAPGCRRGDSGGGSLLERRFPEHAAEVLHHGAGFAQTSEGFAMRPSKATGRWRPRDLAVELPADAAGAIKMRLRNGFEVRVREIGASGPSAVSHRAVTYRRDGGASYWASARDGASVEEWLMLDAGVARSGAVAATWQVEGGTLRQRGEAVEVVDGRGVARMRVTSPRAYGHGGRIVGAELRARGATIELTVDARGEAVLVDPQWTTTASLVFSRQFHTSTTLPTGSPLAGQALITGGDDGLSSLVAAELYDAANETFTQIADMNVPRSHHTATLLANGKVLVAGGVDGNFAPVASAEIFDPALGTWAGVPNMTTARFDFTATLLADGKLLVAGGENAGGPIGSVEIYDPAANTWTAKTSMALLRERHTATLLADGRVLVAGGTTQLSPADATGEVYDPALDFWHIVQAPMNQGRQAHTATLLPDGTVLVAGGLDPVYGLSSAELYDPVLDFWIEAPGMWWSRGQHTATAMPGGGVLVTGGHDGNQGYGYGYGFGGGGSNGALSAAEVFDPISQSWTGVGSMNYGRAGHAASVLSDGTVLVTGGNDGYGYIESNNDVLLRDPDGTPCDSAGTCASGFCVDGVCCDSPCDGTCVACTVAIKGVGFDGKCSGIKAGDDPEDECAESLPCAADGACDGNGACATVLDGTTCDDANACTQSDFCFKGACTGTDPIVCTAKVCETANPCDAATGTCTITSKPDGSPCEGGICIAGECVPDPIPGGLQVTGGVGSTSSGTGGSGTGGSGAGAGPSTGGSGGEATTSSGSGKGGEADLSLTGGCAAIAPGGDRAHLAWLCVGLGLLFVARRREREAR